MYFMQDELDHFRRRLIWDMVHDEHNEERDAVLKQLGRTHKGKCLCGVNIWLF